MNPEGFEEFWKSYPRRVAKGDARRAWERAAKREPELLAKCLAALAWQVPTHAWDGGKYTPHASTYLNQERYDDERPLTAEEQAEMVQFNAWRKAHADDPVTNTITFDVFRRFQRDQRRRA